MSKKPYIDVFIKLIYPKMTELAMATLSEEDCIIDATKLITNQAKRITELEIVMQIDDEMFADIKEQYPRTVDLQAKAEWRRKRVEQALQDGGRTDKGLDTESD